MSDPIVPRRSLLAWVITAYLVVACGYWGLQMVLWLSTDRLRPYINWIDYAYGATHFALMVYAIVSLLRMQRAAVYLVSALLFLKLLSYGRALLTHAVHPIETGSVYVGIPDSEWGMFALRGATDVAVYGLVCLYLWSLWRRGLLR